MKKTSIAIAILEVGVAATLLVVAIKNIITLPSISDGGKLHLLDAKEDYYLYLVFWATLLIAGLMYWKNKKWHWVLTQVILIPLAILFTFLPLASECSDWLKVIYFVLYIVAVALSGRFLYRKSYLEYLGVSPTLKLITVFSGLFLFFIIAIGWVAIYDTLLV